VSGDVMLHETSVCVDEKYDLELLKNAVRYQRWILSALGPIEGAVLEIGAGNGNYTRWLSETADWVTAVEPDEMMAKRLVELGLPNVSVVPNRVEELGAIDAGKRCVVMINVLEHIVDDVAALKAAASILEPNGRALIVVPAHPRLYGRLDARYHHVKRYRRADVAKLLVEAGLTIESVRYFNPVGAIGWAVFVRLLGAPRLKKSSITLTERLAVPVGRTLERLRIYPFGQSVLAVGRRLPA
jgi:ubiquinone/menaquinone biosynthesis C-methylase UbiE